MSKKALVAAEAISRDPEILEGNRSWRAPEWESTRLSATG